NLAVIDRLDERREQFTRAATGTFSEHASLDGFPKRPRLASAVSLSAEYLLFHQRLLSRPAPARPWLARWRPFCPRDLLKDRVEPGRGFGSVSISKRMAPASGATSTSRTSTLSAS